MKFGSNVFFTEEDNLTIEYKSSIYAENNLSNNISYVIDSQNDMVIRGVQSLGGAGHNQATYDKMLGSKGFIIGQDFDQMVDLSQQKFSTQLKSTSLKGNNFIHL